MTTFDLIDIYQFGYVSTAFRTDIDSSLCGCCSMVEEMNKIKKEFINSTAIEEVLKQCICNRHGHQYCIANDAVDKAVRALMESRVVLSDLTTKQFIAGRKFATVFCDFEELYDFVCTVIGPIKGIGPLTIYDTAKRIGHLMSPAIYPKQYVYLAAGAREGAEGLLGTKKLKFREPIQVFTPYFGTFPSIFVEDMLCIFKDSFKRVNSKGGIQGVKPPTFAVVQLIPQVV